MTCHRVVGDGWIWEGILLMNAWMTAVYTCQPVCDPSWCV